MEIYTTNGKYYKVIIVGEVEKYYQIDKKAFMKRKKVFERMKNRSKKEE
jgi:hypothetical protein